MISLPKPLALCQAGTCLFSAGRRLPGQMILLVAATLLLLSATAQGQIAGRLFFLNQQSGAFQVGGIDPSGFFHSTPGGTRPTLAGDFNVVANNTAILAYNQFTGYSEFVVVDGFGDVTFHPQQFGTGFSYLVGTGGDFLFYDGSATTSGIGAVVSTRQGGYFDSQIWSGGLSPWTNITQSDDYLLFYNRTTGLFAETIFSPVYHTILQDKLSVGTQATGYDLMAAVNDNVILYNATNGAFKIMSLYFVGNGDDFPDGRDAGTLKKFYGAILPTVGRVVFYSYGSGDALITHLTQAGQLVTDHESKLPLYTDVLTSGSYVVCYQAESGELDVYSVSTGGKLTLHSKETIGKGYTVVTATQS